MSITTPVSAATPARAMKPTQTATLVLYPSAHRNHTPPTKENGKASMTISDSATPRKLK